MSVHRRARTTVAAALSLVVLATTFAVTGVELIRSATALSTVSETNFQLVTLGFGREDGQTLLAVSGALILVFCALTYAIVVGLWRRREWARHGAILFAASFGLVVGALSLGGVTNDPPAPDAWAGMAVALVNVAVLGLLLAPATADDVERVESERRRAEVARTAHRRVIEPAPPRDEPPPTDGGGRLVRHR